MRDMKKIRFSHVYMKMKGKYYPVPERAVLMEVFVVDRDLLHPGFVRYDTMYFDDEGNVSFYALPKGKVLVLLLRSFDDFFWTTIRRFTPQKYEYYMGCRGEEFMVEVRE